MAITMQGPWTVGVKSKSAAFQQRFLIAGSSNGTDGAYEYSGGNPPPPVAVDGVQWSVAVQHRSANNQPWSQSAERIGIPTSSGSTTVVEIKSNDSGSDEDYNDLILECETILSAVDHVVYGNVKSYSGFCKFNPCWTLSPHVVLETESQMRHALADGAMANVLRELYPKRVQKVERSELEEFSDDSDFRPLMLPMAPEAALEARATSKRFPGSAADIAYTDVARYKDLFKLNCTVQPEAEQLLRFIEYDRTASELIGGPYTGDGDRQILGLTVTDELGNYVFRFSQTLADLAEEIGDHVVGGPGQAIQLRPDVIVQLVEAGDVSYETALYSDIPSVKRINLCFRDRGSRPATCGTGRVIERIGDVWVLPGIANSFDALGRITVTDGRANFTTERAAWTGSLMVWGCFSEEEANPVENYTIRHRRLHPGTGWGDWNFVTEAEHRTHKSALALPWNHPMHRIGPNTTSLKVDGTATDAPAYVNIETDTDWAATDRHLKLKMNSHLYGPAGNAGTVHFRIEGYDSAGDRVAVDDLILYIDNTLAEGAIESISLGAITPGECGLFELASSNAALTVKFNADQANGHLQDYKLQVFRGSNTAVSVTGTAALEAAYASGASFRGTLDVPGNTLGTLEADVTPAGGADWLPTGKTFCAFAFELTTVRRATNGRTLPHRRRQHLELIGIAHTPPPTP